MCFVHLSQGNLKLRVTFLFDRMKLNSNFIIIDPDK